MRTTLRVFGWMVKGVMVVIALGALVTWPVSRGRRLFVSMDRSSAGADWCYWRWRTVGCRDGRIVLGWGWNVSEVDRHWIEERAKRLGERWVWQAKPAAELWDEAYWDRQGLVSWDTWNRNDELYADGGRWFAAPMWSVALIAGAWPAVSATMVVRRRRLGGEGLCVRCGYDLRATPKAVGEGGDVLAVCPECGNEESRSTKPEIRKE
jgi:hypothetical protein